MSAENEVACIHCGVDMLFCERDETKAFFRCAGPLDKPHPDYLVSVAIIFSPNGVGPQVRQSFKKPVEAKVKE